MTDVVRLGVVGGGLMGAGIAEVGARAGAEVVVVEVDDDAAMAAKARIERSMARAVERGKLDGSGRDSAVQKLTFATDLDALADCTHVIEAIVENAEAKAAVFTGLDRIVQSAEAVLASNTSSIPITQLAAATSRPERVIGIHFFYPVPVMPLIELIPTELTSEQTKERAARLAGAVLDKEHVWCTDRAGFVVNALLVPYLLAAVRMYESGVATAEDIDKAVVHGLNHPMGPLTLADFSGLDTMLAVADTLFEEFREPQYAAPAILRRKVEAGMLGRKSGRGFFVYDEE